MMFFCFESVLKVSFRPSVTLHPGAHRNSVLSWAAEGQSRRPGARDGEIAVSAEKQATFCPHFGWQIKTFAVARHICHPSSVSACLLSSAKCLLAGNSCVMPPQNDTAHKSVDQVKQQNAKLETKSLTETTVQVDDKLYNAESLATIHPGGQIFVQAFAGRDATEAFLSYHRRTFPHQKMVEHLVGNAVSVRDCNDKEYLELCQRVEAVLPRHKSFAPLSYYLKITGLMTLALGLEYYIHSTNSYRWYLTGPLGFLFALVGMNIQHDANHGAISRSATVNRLLGWSPLF